MKVGIKSVNTAAALSAKHLTRSAAKAPVRATQREYVRRTAVAVSAVGSLSGSLAQQVISPMLPKTNTASVIVVGTGGLRAV
jgi:hypothetical protein